MEFGWSPNFQYFVFFRFFGHFSESFFGPKKSRIFVFFGSKKSHKKTKNKKTHKKTHIFFELNNFIIICLEVRISRFAAKRRADHRAAAGTVRPFCRGLIAAYSVRHSGEELPQAWYAHSVADWSLLIPSSTLPRSCRRHGTPILSRTDR